MDVKGKVRVTSLKEISSKLTVGSIYMSAKKGDEWYTEFIKASFTGDALKQLKSERIQNKDKVEIEGFLTPDVYADKGGIESSNGLKCVVQKISLVKE